MGVKKSWLDSLLAWQAAIEREEDPERKARLERALRSLLGRDGVTDKLREEMQERNGRKCPSDC